MWGGSLSLSHTHKICHLFFCNVIFVLINVCVWVYPSKYRHKNQSPLTLVRCVTTTSFLTVTLPSLCWKMKSFFTPEKSLRRDRKEHDLSYGKNLDMSSQSSLLCILFWVSKHTCVSNQCRCNLEKTTKPIPELLIPCRFQLAF